MARQTKEDVGMFRWALLGLCLMATGAWGQAVDTTHWQSGTVDLTSGWRAQEGDDMAWAQRAFDDSGWKTVELDALPPAELRAREPENEEARKMQTDLREMLLTAGM